MAGGRRSNGCDGMGCDGAWTNDREAVMADVHVCVCKCMYVHDPTPHSSSNSRSRRRMIWYIYKWRVVRTCVYVCETRYDDDDPRQSEIEESPKGQISRTKA